MNDLRRAWAVLELKPGSSFEALRAQYLKLVKRWHPDRFIKDPAGAAEATSHLQQINAAYRVLLEATVQPPAGAAPSDDGLRPTGRRLSREEIDRIVKAMGTKSWIEIGLFRRRGFWYVSGDDPEDLQPTPTLVGLLVAIPLIGLTAFVADRLGRHGVVVPTGATALAVIGALLAGTLAAILFRHRQRP